MLVRRRALNAIAPVLIGLAAFFTVFGPSVLDPTNIGWLRPNDSALQYMGWVFFRHEPWSWPIVALPHYGMELSSSIVYTDSIPLLELPAKLLSPLLPQTFQYFGFWVLSSFVLQSVFAWRLAGSLSPDLLVRGTMSVLFTMAPIMLWRGSIHVSHLTLMGQWLIIAALWLAIDERVSRSTWRWTLLLACGLFVHAYLFAMCGVIWGAHLIATRHERRHNIDALKALVAPLSVLFAAAWFLGYGSVDSGAAFQGFGRYKATPLALIDPGNALVGQWSRVLPDLPGDAGQMESFNYLGLGVICLLAVALSRSRARALLAGAIRRRLPLAGALALMAAFALSNNIGGSAHFIAIPLPTVVDQSLTIFRASGRMVWPLVYALTAAAVVLVVRSFPRRVAGALLAGCLALQLADTSVAWGVYRGDREQLAAHTWPTRLVSPFWEQAARRYRSIQMLYWTNIMPGWTSIASLADAHDLPTTVAYMARAKYAGWLAQDRRLHAATASGCYPADAFFIVNDDAAPAVRRHLRHGIDLLQEIDGYLVLAPNWYRVVQCRSESS